MLITILYILSTSTRSVVYTVYSLFLILPVHFCKYKINNLQFLFLRSIVIVECSFSFYFSWMNVVCRPRIKIPASVMMPIAHVVEWTYKLLGPYGMKVPQLTPSRIRLLSCTRSFKCSKAQDRIGYTPIISLQVLCCFG